MRAFSVASLFSCPTANNASVTSMIEQFWATICVPFENYIRGQRVQLARSKRNAELAASGYLIFDPIVEEIITPPPSPSTPTLANPRRRKVRDGQG